jgi:hypothetical protein
VAPVVAPSAGDADSMPPLESLLAKLPLAKWRRAVLAAVAVFTTICLGLVLLALNQGVARLLIGVKSIEDADSFVKALKDWYMVVYNVDTTPRGLKRFHNYARFYAMMLELARTPDPTKLEGVAALTALRYYSQKEWKDFVGDLDKFKLEFQHLGSQECFLTGNRDALQELVAEFEKLDAELL